MLRVATDFYTIDIAACLQEANGRTHTRANALSNKSSRSISLVFALRLQPSLIKRICGLMHPMTFGRSFLNLASAQMVYGQPLHVVFIEDIN